MVFHTEILLAVAALCVLARIGGGIFRQVAMPSCATYELLGFFFIGGGLVFGNDHLQIRALLPAASAGERQDDRQLNKTEMR